MGNIFHLKIIIFTSLLDKMSFYPFQTDTTVRFRREEMGVKWQ